MILSSERQDSNLQPPASKAGKLTVVILPEIQYLYKYCVWYLELAYCDCKLQIEVLSRLYMMQYRCDFLRQVSY